MSLIETDVYKILSSSEELVNKMDSIRGHKVGKLNMIFVDKVNESYIKEENAPFIKIELISELNTEYSDDLSMAEDQRVQVAYWVSNSQDSLELKEIIDKLMEENGMEQYYGTRYLDPDIPLKMNARKYRRIDWKSR